MLRALQRVLDELTFGLSSQQPVAAPSARLVVEQARGGAVGLWGRQMLLQLAREPANSSGQQLPASSHSITPLPRPAQVPEFRAALLRRGGWEELARRQAAQQLGPEAQSLQRSRLERMLQSIDLLCGMEQGAGGAAGAAAQQQQGEAALPPAAKLEAYRQVKPGVWEWWASYSLRLNTDRPAEAVSSGGGGSSDENQPRQPTSGGSGSGADGPAAKGKRWRLQPLPEGEQRALPANGKLCVLFGGHACEAALSLPSSETRCDCSAVQRCRLAGCVLVTGLAGHTAASPSTPLACLQSLLQGDERPGARAVGHGGRPGRQRPGPAAQAAAAGAAQRAGQGGGGVASVRACGRGSGGARRPAAERPLRVSDCGEPPCSHVKSEAAMFTHAEAPEQQQQLDARGGQHVAGSCTV